jgi:membrane protein
MTRLRAWLSLFWRTLIEFRNDHLTDWAAALTYYSVLAIFPALIALVAILALVGQYPDTTNALLRIVDEIGPASTVETLRSPIEHVVTNKSGAGIALGVALIASLWSASSYLAAFTRASNQIYGVEDRRPFWKLRPLQMLVTLAMVLLLALVGVALVLTGPVADAVAKPIGLGNAAVTVWDIAKWPALLVVGMLAFSVLYYGGPNVRFRWITPGSIVAVLLWVLVSAGFAVYVANFGSYDKTYGSLGGVIVFLVWVWLVNCAILLGAELNAEIERRRERDGG